MNRQITSGNLDYINQTQNLILEKIQRIENTLDQTGSVLYITELLTKLNELEDKITEILNTIRRLDTITVEIKNTSDIINRDIRG